MNLPRPEPLRAILKGPLVLLGVIIILPLLARGSYGYLLQLAQLCGIYAIIVTGLSLLMGFTGQVSLGHAGYYGFGAYVGAVAVQAGGWPLWLAAPFAVVAGGLLALLTGFMVLRLKGHHLALATLCIGVIIYECINKMRITGGASGMFDLPRIDLFGLLPDTALANTWFIWMILWLVILWAVMLTRSPTGLALKAIHSDEEAARAVGIHTFGLKLKIFIASGMLAALAGVLYAFVYSPSYLGPEEFKLLFSVTLLTMVVIGGMGSIWGGLAGAVILTGLHEVITLVCEQVNFTHIGAGEHLVFGLLLVLTLIFRPQGVISGIAHPGARKEKQRRVHG
ncbi:MAG: branched-chain amino acid ABC transporter permease [Spartobacteria bacterium]|nr:branched-chain amino acid ABC transporter permease [Spartobacteria bacterium]